MKNIISKYLSKKISLRPIKSIDQALAYFISSMDEQMIDSILENQYEYLGLSKRDFSQ